MSVSFQPADLTTTTNTILEEGEPTEAVQDYELDTSVSLTRDSKSISAEVKTSHYTTHHDQQAELIVKVRLGKAAGLTKSASTTHQRPRDGRRDYYISQ
jgi:hypothetical protein